jgi:hypothetical protein
MKKNYLTGGILKKTLILFLLIQILTKAGFSQTVSNFENNVLSSNTYWNGSDLSGGFSSGNAFFVNRFDTAYGGSWSGFVYSDMADDSTAGISNQYSAITGKGVNNSINYGLFYYSTYTLPSRLKLFSRDTVLGFYITNSTWAALSMLNGDVFSKKFGGSSGNDPDWFKLSVTGYVNGNSINDTVDYFLADYRFINNSQDYILNSWAWVNLTSLGMVDSLEFKLSSSDTGAYGMNTPAYFCIDNFITRSNYFSLQETGLDPEDIMVYPNPATEDVFIKLRNNLNNKIKIELFDLNGTIIFSSVPSCNSEFAIKLDFPEKGFYFLKISDNKNYILRKIVKI